MIDATTIAYVAELKPEDFSRWRHDPVGVLFFTFLADQLGLWREAASDMVMDGLFSADQANPQRNAHYVGGQMRAFDDLLRIKLSDIQGFYREASGAEEDGQHGAEARQGA